MPEICEFRQQLGCLGCQGLQSSGQGSKKDQDLAEK